MQFVSVIAFLLVIPSVADLPADKELVRRAPKAAKSDQEGHAVNIDANGVSTTPADKELGRRAPKAAKSDQEGHAVHIDANGVSTPPADKELVRRAPKTSKSDHEGHAVKIDADGYLQKANKAEVVVEKKHPENPVKKGTDLTEEVGGGKEGFDDKKHRTVHANFQEELQEEEATHIKDKYRFEDDDDDNDVTLDELEAMTIEAAMLKKHPVPRRRRVDCKWTEWENEGRCSQTCGGGMQPRKRKQAPPAAHGGRACDGKDHDILKPCDNDPCPTTPAPTPAPTTTTAAAVRISDVSFCMLLAAVGAFVLNTD